jgi:hypothetical protein
MRNTTFIALKLLGILSIYWAISDIGYIFMSFMSFLRGGPSWGVLLASAVELLFLGIVVGFPYFLLTHTDRILEKLKLPPADPPSIASMEPAQLLRTGLILVGAFAVIDALPSIVSTVSFYIIFSPKVGKLPSENMGLERIIPPVLKFLLGCIVIGRSQRLAESVFPPPREEER